MPLAAGRWTSIVGPNGAGKSTLLRTLAGLLPHSGAVALLGRPLADWPHRQRARNRLQEAPGEVLDRHGQGEIGDGQCDVAGQRLHDEAAPGPDTRSPRPPRS